MRTRVQDSPSAHARIRVPRLEKPWLTIGNQKLGPTMPAFNLLAGYPASVVGGTCPGATAWCDEACYAKKGRQSFRSVRTRYAHNLERLTRTGGLALFTEQVPAEL